MQSQPPQKHQNTYIINILKHFNVFVACYLVAEALIAVQVIRELHHVIYSKTAKQKKYSL